MNRRDFLTSAATFASVVLPGCGKYEPGVPSSTGGAAAGSSAGAKPGGQAPPDAAARSAADRQQSLNNLKRIGVALHNYHDAHRSFPPAAVLGPDGKTAHSWRVAILPFLGQGSLYQLYRFDEPWDSPANRQVLQQMPPEYRLASDPTATTARYFVLTGPGTPFDGPKGKSLADIRDGTSNTLFVVEAKRDVPWTRPEDIAYDPARPLPALGGFDPGGFLGLLGDGSVQNIPARIDERNLRAMITCAGGEVVMPF